MVDLPAGSLEGLLPIPSSPGGFRDAPQARSAVLKHSDPTAAPQVHGGPLAQRSSSREALLIFLDFKYLLLFNCRIFYLPSFNLCVGKEVTS